MSVDEEKDKLSGVQSENLCSSLICSFLFFVLPFQTLKDDFANLGDARDKLKRKIETLNQTLDEEKEGKEVVQRKLEAAEKNLVIATMQISKTEVSEFPEMFLIYFSPFFFA